METEKLSGLSPDELEGVLKNPASSAERKQQAAALLFVHYWPVLVAVAAHSLKGHRADEAVDVVQELFASALQSIVGSYDPAKGTSFLNFLRTCVRNRAISFARLAVFRRQKAINPTHLAAVTLVVARSPDRATTRLPGFRQSITGLLLLADAHVQVRGGPLAAGIAPLNAHQVMSRFFIAMDGHRIAVLRQRLDVAVALHLDARTAVAEI